ncbi:MAG: hypothetical protein ABEK10_01850 [Candidatus Nanosalina sp.]
MAEIVRDQKYGRSRDHPLAPETTPEPSDIDLRIRTYFKWSLKEKRESSPDENMSYHEKMQVFLVHYLDEKVEEFDPGMVFEQSSQRLELAQIMRESDYSFSKAVSMDDKNKPFTEGNYDPDDHTVNMSVIPVDLQEELQELISDEYEGEYFQEIKMFPEEYNRFTGFNSDYNTRTQVFRSKLAHELTHWYLDRQTSGEVPKSLDEAFAQVTHRLMLSDFKGNDPLEFNINSRILGAYSRIVEPEELAWMIRVIRDKAKYVRSMKRSKDKDFYPVDWLRRTAVKIADQDVEGKYDFLKFFLPKEYYSEMSEMEKVYEGKMAELLEDIKDLKQILQKEYYFGEDFINSLETDLEFEIWDPRQLLEEAVEKKVSLRKIQEEMAKGEQKAEKDEKKLLKVLKDLGRIKNRIENGEMRNQMQPGKKRLVLKKINEIEEEAKNSGRALEKLEERHDQKTGLI